MRKPQYCGLGLVLMTLAVLLLSANPAWGQDVTATITGTVSDPSGAPIVGATVIAHDTERGTSWSSLTNESGVYNLIRVPVGNYDLKVEAKGFQTALHTTFTLVLNQTARIDIQMKMGAVNETVNVTGAAPILQTDSTQVSTLIDADTATTLPLAARNYIQLALLSPGTTTNNPDALANPHVMTDEGRPYINGNREQAVEFFLDGIINDEGKNNEVAYQPNLDAIQEFNIITVNAPADFGNYAGGIVSVAIKSGTNQFHGDAFEFFRNDYLDSGSKTGKWNSGFGPVNTGFGGAGRLRYNMFGGTGGGPIKKDKLFFFGDYQGMRIPVSGPSHMLVATQRERAGDFSQVCTENGGTVSAAGCSKVAFNITDPYTHNPAPWNCLAATCNGNAGANEPESTFATNLFSSTYAKDYPLPQTDTTIANNFTFNAGNHFNSDQGDARIDYVASEKDHFFGRFSKYDTSLAPFSDLPFAAVSSVPPADEPGWSAALNWSHVFNPNLVNEARLGVNVFRFFQNLSATTSLGNVSNALFGQPTTAPPITSLNGQQPGLLAINISTPAGTASLGNQLIMQNFLDTEIQYEDNLVITKGRHTLNTGFQFIRERNNWSYAGNNGSLGIIQVDTKTGFGLADMWLGDVAGNTPRDSGLAGGLYHFNRGNILSAYVQDDWRATSTLTLNLGVRFEDHTPFYDTQNHVVNFGLYTGQIETPVAGQYGISNRALYNNYTGLGDWNPRLGFAWSPAFLGGKTVFRAAYGISSYREGGGANEELQMNLPYGTTTSISPSGLNLMGPNFAWPGLPASCAVVQPSCYMGPTRIRVYPPNFRPTLIQQWNFSIQHQLTKTLTVQLGYVGQKGSHLINFEDLAQLEGLNSQGEIAKAGQTIAKYVPGPFLGGQLAGATPANNLYYSENPMLGGAESLAGANMDNGNQRYDSLQAVLQKRIGNGLMGQVAYTYSKCLSDSPGYFGVAGGGWTVAAATQSSSGIYGTEDIYDQRKNWGPCYYDQTQIVSGYFTYELPVGHGKTYGHDLNPVLNALVENWQIATIVSAHTGNALTLNYFGGWAAPAGYGDSSGTNNIAPYTLSDLPNCNGPIKIVNQFKGSYIQWFDTSNISAPAPKTFGTCSVGNIRGPRDQNWDVSLQKDFAVTENKKFQFRLDMLNAFNYAHWTFAGSVWNGSFSAGGGSANTGKILGSQGERQLQLALKFFF